MRHKKKQIIISCKFIVSNRYKIVVTNKIIF